MHTGFWHYRSYRFYMSIIMGLCIFANMLVRATLSIGMVCMVNTTATGWKEEIFGNNSLENATMPVASQCGSRLSEEDYGGSETWTSTQQSFLFSAIYWGGAISCIPAGLFADRYSPKYLVLACFALQTIGCLLTPLAITFGGIVPVFIVRFIMEIGGQAVFNPAIAVIMARWIPPAERSTVLALYTGGNQIAFIIAMPLNAWLCRQRQFLGGWPSIFYANGLAMLLSTIPWMLLVSDKPEQSKYISKNELDYIKVSLSAQSLGNKKGLLKRVPWFKMMTSMALWSCIIGNFAACLMLATLESYIPTYFKQALHLDLESNGLLSALPYLAMWVSKMLFAVVADALKKKTSLSHTWICRISNCLNTFISGALLIACGYMDCGHIALAVFFLTAANFMSSGQVTGYFTSVVCIAPAYTGLVNAFTRFSGQVASVIAPYIVGSITVEGTAEEWRLVYYITASALIITGVHFMFFGSTKVQPWAVINDLATVTTGDKNEKAQVFPVEPAKLVHYYAKTWNVPVSTPTRKLSPS